VQVGVRHTRDYRIFQTKTLDVTDPRDGKPFVRTIIETNDYANVLAVTPRDEVVLVRQFRFGIWANSLELPGGVIEKGEAAIDGVVRELEEETGYRAAKVSLLGVAHNNPAVFNNQVHCFLAEGCELKTGGSPDDGEDLQVVLVPRSALRGLVKRGEITHTHTLTALLFDSLK
jgi:ADP-ribose pyrophosphatase